MPRRIAHHRPVGDDLGAHHRPDVHPRHQLGRDFPGQSAHQRHRPDSPDLPRGIGLRLVGRAVRHFPADRPCRGGRQPALYRDHAPSAGRRMGPPGAAAAHAPPSAVPHSGELHPVRGRAGDDLHPAQHARGSRAGGRPVALRGCHRALRHHLLRALCPAGFRLPGVPRKASRLVEGRGRRGARRQPHQPLHFRGSDRGGRQPRELRRQDLRRRW